MQPPYAAALYAGLCALLLVALTANAARARGQARLAFGDGGDPALIRALRAHGNAAETIPAALIVILLTDMLGAPGWVVHLLGLALVAGRGLHAWHCLVVPEKLGLRVAGMALTLATIGLGGLGLIGHALAGGRA